MVMCVYVDLIGGGALVIGNVKENSFADIWNSEKRREYLLANLDGERRKYTFCRNCEGQVLGDVITVEDAKIIKKRLLGKS